MMAQTHKPPAGASIFLRAGALILLVATAIALVGKPALAREETWIVLDAASGAVLSERDADEINYPASLTKMMTLYLAFEALESRRIGFDTPFMVSEHAAMQAPSKLGLLPGDTISVRDLILGMVTKSANDAAVVMAENTDWGKSVSVHQKDGVEANGIKVAMLENYPFASPDLTSMIVKASSHQNIFM